MLFTDRPRFAPPIAYDRAIERMCARLAGLPGVKCIYQIGHVTTPGISDLDLLVVFKADAICNWNPLQGLSRDECYLFVHGPFAVTMSDFAEAIKHTFFHNYQLRWGTAPPPASPSLPLAEELVLKQQVALEYLVRMWVTLSVEMTYGIVKLRNLFLHAKGLLYDCEFLGISQGEFLDTVQSIVTLRGNWLKKRPTWPDLERTVRKLHASLQELLSTRLPVHPFYLPRAVEHRLARHVLLVPAQEVQVVHRGMPLPAALGGLGRKYFNCQHRWNHFEFHLPVQSGALPPVVDRSFALRKTMSVNRSRCFPHFLTLSSSLTYS